MDDEALHKTITALSILKHLNMNKAQVKAREALVIVGGLAYSYGLVSAESTSSSDAETSLKVFEARMVKDGLGSKVRKVRQQVRVKWIISACIH